MDRTWNRMRYYGDFTFLYIPYLAVEVEMMMKNLILFLKHEYRDEVLHYFTEEAKCNATEDEWNSKTKRVTCETDSYLEKAFEDDTGLDKAKL